MRERERRDKLLAIRDGIIEASKGVNYRNQTERELRIKSKGTS
jgi:hypothetical protein